MKKSRFTEEQMVRIVRESNAVRVFLTRVVAEKQLPFAVKVPNATTRGAMAEADSVVRRRLPRFTTSAALFNELEKDAGK